VRKSRLAKTRRKTHHLILREGGEKSPARLQNQITVKAFKRPPKIPLTQQDLNFARLLYTLFLKHEMKRVTKIAALNDRWFHGRNHNSKCSSTPSAYDRKDRLPANLVRARAQRISRYRFSGGSGNVFPALLRLAPLVAAVLLSGSSSNSACATTIVVARTASEIVIGADSKVTDAYGNDVNRRACKILQVGNLFIAFEGLEIDRETGFSVPEIATMALQLKPSASAAEKTSILMGFLVSRLFDELPQLKKRAPETFKKKIEGGQFFLRIIVGGFERGRPLIFVRNFRAIQLSPQQIGVSVIPDDCLDDCRGDVVTRFLGETEAIDGLPEETAGFWQRGLIEGVRHLIETEIAARSEYVGPPIDLLRIDKNGARWIQRKPQCGETRNEKRRGRSAANTKPGKPL
jgi:hypothetical protein